MLKVTQIHSSKIPKLIQYEENFDDGSTLSFVIHPQNDPARGQVQFCHNLTAKSFKKGMTANNQELPEIKIRSHTTSFYEKFTIEILPSQTN